MPLSEDDGSAKNISTTPATTNLTTTLLEPHTNTYKVMSRVRKISISDLSRHNYSGRTTSRKYKVAFYLAIASLSLVFLYLIYQNLFTSET